MNSSTFPVIKAATFIFFSRYNLLLLLFAFSVSVAVSQPVAIHGGLKVEGTQLVGKNGQPVVLRGMSFGWHNFWPRFYNEDAVQWLYEDWKCNVVRAAMGVEPPRGYIKDPAGSTKKIKAVVDGAIRSGIYVIIDWHSHNINLKEAKAFFAEMATTYGKYDNVIYEIFNEPDHESWPEVKAYSEEVIRTIRQIDPDNIILVGSPHWDQHINLPAADPIRGFDNLMYTVHFYAATHKQELRDRTDGALASGLPIFISECAGMEATGDGPLNEKEWKIWIDWMEARRLSWITWSVSDKDETCSVLKKSASSTGNWKTSDLKKSGIMTREFLRRYAQKDSSFIHLNQLGFYPNGPKVAIITRGGADSFVIINADSRKEVYRGSLEDAAPSTNSSLKGRRADFSELTKPGLYVLAIEGVGESWPFRIGRNVHKEVAISSLKGFYYQRVSTPLTEPFAGKWARPAGHPDTVVFIHPSAASATRPAGTRISSAGGWYDAGDYNKYIVNSGITMGTLLSAYEDWRDHFDRLKTNIPESSNKVPDVLDEIVVNLRWMLTMQDPADGGVYNKCTNANFDGMVMPGITKLPRYVVQKGTAATLDFAAVMAQSARIFSKYKKQLPGLGDSCLRAATSAWNWALEHPAMVYDQQAMNREYDPDINTGGYGDRNFNDEWYWAAAELLATTGDERYQTQLAASQKAPSFSLPGWPNVGMMGYFTLLRHSKRLPSGAKKMTEDIRSYIIRFADSLEANMRTNAFNTVMGGRVQDFSWGSNAVAANQAMVLLHAWKLTKDRKYVNAALSNLDYILGRNATGYCFVTGAGSHSPMYPHHRQSAADGLPEPVPGLLAGGPNPGRQDKCYYARTEPETCYTDRECSFASNEIAINWNAPLVYVVNGVEEVMRLVD